MLLVYLDNSLNIQALLVCPAMSGPTSLSVIVLSCNFSQPAIRTGPLRLRRATGFEATLSDLDSRVQCYTDSAIVCGLMVKRTHMITHVSTVDR